LISSGQIDQGSFFSHMPLMEQIDQDFLAVVRELGATTERIISLERVGPPMVAKGYDLEAVYHTLMRLSRNGSLVLIEERNAVRFP